MCGSSKAHVTAPPAIGLPSPSYSEACNRIVSPTAARRTWPGVITTSSAVLPPPPGASAGSLHAAALPSSTIEQGTNTRQKRQGMGSILIELQIAMLLTPAHPAWSQLLTFG